ncbi:MAG TPA: hypothetical protein VFL14_15260 [Xanthomonadales bacterium]|nr:hypothetical protein [Xanthomonadales bacterium]
MTARLFATLSLLAVPLGLPAVELRIAPANPVEFERMAVRLVTDSCTFDEDAVEVRLEGRTFVVTQRSNPCLVPGPAEVVEVQLGAVPPGDYRVELREAGLAEPVGALEFSVSGLVRGATFPPPPRPLANFEGLWWNGVDAGWGISLKQGATSGLFGALLVLDAGGTARWYSVQSGSWETSTRWSGRVLRSSNEAGRVTHADVGTATFDFTMRPGSEDVATLTLTIDGVATTRSIKRLRL